MKNKQIRELVSTHFPTFSHLATLSYRQIVFTLTLLALVLGNVNIVGAYTYVISHRNQALNTNNNFRRINGGGPRLSTWNKNLGDRDQHLSFVHNPQMGAHMIVNLSTGLCLNVYNIIHTALVNTYKCNRGDIEQQFRLHDLGNGTYRIRLKKWVNGKELCFDHDGNQNYGVVRALNCSYHPNQVWKLDKVSNYIASDVVDNFKPVKNSDPVYGSTNLIRTGGNYTCDMKLNLKYTWWGRYAKLTDCQAVEMSRKMENVSLVLEALGLSGNLLSFFTGLGLDKYASDINYCQDTTGNTYVKLPYAPTVFIQPISCK